MATSSPHSPEAAAVAAARTIALQMLEERGRGVGLPQFYGQVSRRHKH
jgi:hypothetical protein